MSLRSVYKHGSAVQLCKISTDHGDLSPYPYLVLAYCKLLEILQKKIAYLFYHVRLQRENL